MSSPMGSLTLFEEDGALVALEWGRVPGGSSSSVLADGKDQLGAYFDRRLHSFSLPLRPAGTPFQKSVWQCMRAIPFGLTRTYGELAHELNSAARAVGGACGRNPLPIIIPCHRVLGSAGLGGYSGGDGLSTKRQLLRLEGALA